MIHYKYKGCNNLQLHTLQAVLVFLLGKTLCRFCLYEVLVRLQQHYLIKICVVQINSHMERDHMPIDTEVSTLLHLYYLN